MSAGTMLFNPFTGTPRHPSDIASDPRGVLIWDGEEPLRAAPGAAPAAPAAQPEATVRDSRKVQPEAPAVPGMWDHCLRIGALPLIDEALRTFAADQTEDNATCLIREVLAAAPAVPVPPELLADSAIDEIDRASGWHPENARKVGLRLYARAIEAAARKVCGVRS